MDGDAKLCMKHFEELDETVDCFDAGGFMFAFHIGDKVYKVKQADWLKNILATEGQKLRIHKGFKKLDVKETLIENDETK